jgi:hypothetical protein
VVFPEQGRPENITSGIRDDLVSTATVKSGGEERADQRCGVEFGEFCVGSRISLSA